ncbi:MAG: hypothetical protein JXQ93_06325 [Flavobacteriaceae bacterium]
MKIKSILLAVFFLSTFSIVQQEMTTYKKDNYSIEYPESWELDTSGQMNTKFVVSAKEINGFSENVNFIVQNLKGYGFDLEKFVTLSENQFKQIPSAKVIESKRIKDANSEKHSITVEGDFNGTNLTIKQFYFFKDDKAYILTYTNTLEGYKTTKALGDKILNSFKLN